MVFLDSLISLLWRRKLRLIVATDLTKVIGFQIHCLFHWPGMTAVGAVSMGQWRGAGLRRQKMLKESSRGEILLRPRGRDAHGLLGQWEAFRVEVPRFIWENGVWGP